MFWGEFGFLMSEFEMDCFQPNLVTEFVPWHPSLILFANWLIASIA